MRSQTAHVYVTPGNEEGRYLPEGPRKMTLRGKEVLAWVDIQIGSDARFGMIFAKLLAGGGEDAQITCPGRPGFILPVEGGDRVLVGIDKELKLCNLATGEWSESLARIPDHDPHTMMNDAEIVPGGKAIVFGTKVQKLKEPIAHLYLFTVEDHRITVLADKQTISNGKVMFNDDRGLLLFDIDTPTRTVARYRLDVAARKASFEGVAVDLKNEEGLPDGMRYCGDGTAIVALYNPHFAEHGKAIRYNLSTGEAIEEWLTPGSPRVTCPSVEESRLILTTAVEEMPPEMRPNCPNAGCLFIGEIDPPARPAAGVVRFQ